MKDQFDADKIAALTPEAAFRAGVEQARRDEESDWFTADDIAGLGGMPSDRRDIQALADIEGWRWRERPCGVYRCPLTGGTQYFSVREYHLADLPAYVQAKLKRVGPPRALS